MPDAIPTIFHLTSKSKVDLPPAARQNIDQIRTLYPEYEVCIHDDEDVAAFMHEHFPDYYEQTVRRMPNFIMRIDTVRYMWMHVFGGVYCDTDVLFRRRYDFGTGVEFVRREWTWPRDDRITDSVHNCWFASAPGHPIWTELLDGIAQNVDALSKRREPAPPTTRLGKLAEKVLVKARLRRQRFPAVFDTTGPNAISRIITDRGLLARYSDVKVLPASLIYQRGLSTGHLEVADFVHQAGGSWYQG